MAIVLAPGGTIDVTVTNTSGDPVPTGTPLVYEPTGVIYLTTSSFLRDATPKSVNIKASSDQSGGSGLGAVGNIPVGAIVSFTSPLIDLQQEAVVTAVVTTGADAEDLDTDFRQRVIDRFQKRPQGGAPSDIEIWGEEAAGINNVYPYAGDIPGTVEAYCEATVASSGNPDGFPTQPQLDDVLALIDLDLNGFASRRPANMKVSTLSITRRDFTVEVIGLEAPDITAAKADITAAMTTLFASFEPFIGGLTVTALDRITQTEVGGVCQDVARASGGTISSVILKAPPETQVTFSALVTGSANDATQIGSTVTLTDTTLALVSTTTIGTRFVNVNIPVGATIISATITLTAKTAKTIYSEITVRGEAVRVVAVEKLRAEVFVVRDRSAYPELERILQTAVRRARSLGGGATATC